ncbi:hypothetical protein EsH8_I_000849 [Colletotrichum jinshuiense]
MTSRTEVRTDNKYPRFGTGSTSAHGDAKASSQDQYGFESKQSERSLLIDQPTLSSTPVSAMTLPTPSGPLPSTEPVSSGLSPPPPIMNPAVTNAIPVNQAGSTLAGEPPAGMIEAAIPNLHESSTDNPEQKYTISVDSSKIWNFSRSRIWVAYEKEIPVPSHLKSRWPEIESRLLDDLNGVKHEMIAEQAKLKCRQKQHPRRRNIYPDLRMSGRQEKFFSKFVTISPCVWVLCGSKSCRDKVRRVMRNLSLPINFVDQPIEVHDRAPEFYAIRSCIPLSQLQTDIDKDFAINIEKNSEMNLRGGCILHHVEANQTTGECKSACGLLCCSTFLKNGKVIEQRVSRVGGLLTNDFGPYDYVDCPIAMTTSHGIFNYLQRNGPRTETLADLTDSLLDFTLLNSEDDFAFASSSGSETTSDDDSDSDQEFDSDNDNTESVPQPSEDRYLLGSKDPSQVIQWLSVEEVVGIKFIRQQLPYQDPGQNDGFDDSEPGDYTLLGSDNLKGFRNISSLLSNLEIKTYMTNDELIEGPLSMVFGADDLSEVYLLPGLAKMPTGREELPVRKVQLSAPLAVGTSGTWLVKDSAFAGMIVAAFPDQPLAFFMTAQDILRSITNSFPKIPEPSFGHQATTYAIRESWQWREKSRLYQESVASSSLTRTSIAAETVTDITIYSSDQNQPPSSSIEGNPKTPTSQKKADYDLNEQPSSPSEENPRTPTQKKVDYTISQSLPSSSVEKLETPTPQKNTDHDVDKKHQRNPHVPAPRGSGKKHTTTIVWYCHKCSGGPLNSYTDSHCPYCYHQKCGYCATSHIKFRQVVEGSINSRFA